MMEYIGASGIPIKFDSVPSEDEIDFNFILGFAIDADASGNPQNGTFSPYWETTLTPKSVAAIKKSHPNVKVLASLSGWSLGQTVLRWYNPTDPNLWISNAVSSLGSIITTYHLDGIDIDYENFPNQKSSNSSSSFAFCIGELITRLKKQRLISVASIAPFIVRLRHMFNSLMVMEIKWKRIQGNAFFDALSLLEKNGFEINGVMIFSADAASTNNFYYERKSQAFLLNSTNNN
ncbi:hypothetical protein Prudu_005474 [Prunus dulcis]|uniref:GH18 domain-containing protein n=1 Tax=Prunus dulcis TaxID=3755 RepID=A0A4Y1QXN7_PRUDU|nr:hypothetical protein Prudu_005474 [Prunus dulcis]